MWVHRALTLLQLTGRSEHGGMNSTTMGTKIVLLAGPYSGKGMLKSA